MAHEVVNASKQFVDYFIRLEVNEKEPWNGSRLAQIDKEDCLLNSWLNTSLLVPNRYRSFYVDSVDCLE